MNGRVGALAGAALIVLVGCSGSAADGGATTTDVSTTSVAPTSTTSSTTIVTTTVPVDDDRELDCVVTVAAGDSLGKIAGGIDAITLEQLAEENGIADGQVIHPGDELDICHGNDVDDVTGVSRLASAPVAVRRQQEALNELFAPYRMLELVVDGDSGPLTRQLLCAARLGLGLPVTGAHLPAGSDEEATLFEAETISVPDGAPVWARKWILIDKTCQVIFTGEKDALVNVYPTSTGEPGFETREAQAVAAFRYDPALDTDGWHDSTNFPVEGDNPLNGNMYKPLYFNSGQAIHGANYVPPEPRSKGCARTFPLHQDEILRWLELDGRTEATWRESDIGVTVTVQGDYRDFG